MTISGFLESFSFPELLRLIDLGSKSGRLILQVRSAPNKPELVGLYHIWFQEGRLVGKLYCFRQNLHNFAGNFVNFLSKRTIRVT